MSNTRNLWFPIERVFAQVDDLCGHARAEILRKQARQDAGGDMSQMQTHSDRDETRVDFQKGFPGLFNDDDQTHVGMVDVVSMRGELRDSLGGLKRELGETLTEREVYHTMFPIVVYCDEMLRGAVGEDGESWTPLQRELYDVDNGGELFFTFADNLMRKPDTLPLIFEVFYFCLSAGFVGRYEHDPDRIEEYLERLKVKIPVYQPTDTDRVKQEDYAVELVKFPKHYYAWSSLVAALSFAVFWLVGSLWG